MNKAFKANTAVLARARNITMIKLIDSIISDFKKHSAAFELKMKKNFQAEFDKVYGKSQ